MDNLIPFEIAGKDYYLHVREGKYHPVKLTDSGSRLPVRGFNKNGVRVWRTYASQEEAIQNFASFQ